MPCSRGACAAGLHQGRRSRYGIATGLLLTLPNPAPLAAWIAIAGALWPTIPRDAAFVLAAGVASARRCGSRTRALHRRSAAGASRDRACFPKIALALLAALAAVGARPRPRLGQRRGPMLEICRLDSGLVTICTRSPALNRGTSSAGP